MSLCRIWRTVHQPCPSSSSPHPQFRGENATPIPSPGPSYPLRPPSLSQPPLMCLQSQFLSSPFFFLVLLHACSLNMSFTFILTNGSVLYVFAACHFCSTACSWDYLCFCVSLSSLRFCCCIAFPHWDATNVFVLLLRASWWCWVLKLQSPHKHSRWDILCTSPRIPLGKYSEVKLLFRMFSDLIP